MHLHAQVLQAKSKPLPALLTKGATRQPSSPDGAFSLPTSDDFHINQKESQMYQESNSHQVIPAYLSTLIKWKDYALGYPNFWPTENSARHFLNTRKAKLIASGALFRTTTGWMVDSKTLDEILFELLQYADQEQLVLPLDSSNEGDTK